jgi:hypothetical protein
LSCGYHGYSNSLCLSLSLSLCLSLCLSLSNTSLSMSACLYLCLCLTLCVQFVFTCWYLCNLSLEDLYHTSFAAFDLSKQGCIMLDDLPYIFRNMYGSHWRKIDAAKKIFMELHLLGVSNNLRIDYPTYRATILNHTFFLNSVFEVHRRVREVVFGERHWVREMGTLGLSAQCLKKKWGRDKLMECVKFNTAEEIARAALLHEKHCALRSYPRTDDVFLDRHGAVIPDRDDDQDHLRKKNHVNGVDRTAWVYSAQPARDRDKQRQQQRDSRDGDRDGGGAEDRPTLIPEHAELDADLEGGAGLREVDLHYGRELPREVHREDTARMLAPQDRPRQEIVVDRLTTRRLTKAGKRLKECHQFARVTEMLDYDDAQQEGLQAETDALFADLPSRARVTFSHENDFDHEPISYRHLYDECVVRPSFVRASRDHNVHFPGGVAVAAPGMRNIERVRGVPVTQLIHERHYPHEEASVCSENNLEAEQRKIQSAIKKEQIKLNRQARRVTARVELPSATEDAAPTRDMTSTGTTRAASTGSSSSSPLFNGMEAVLIPNTIRFANPFARHPNIFDNRDYSQTQSSACNCAVDEAPVPVAVENNNNNNYYLVKKTQEILDKHKEKLANQTYKLKCTAKKSEIEGFEKKKTCHQKFSLRKKTDSQSRGEGTAKTSGGNKKKKHNLKLRMNNSNSNNARPSTS